MHWLEHAPILLIGLALMGLLLAGHELGFQAARRLFPNTSGARELGNVTASAMALLSLLLAFTFSAAQARFNLRQQLVVSEANAMATAYLRIQTLQQPWRGQLNEEMHRYVDARAGSVRAEAAFNPGRPSANARQTERLQVEIWKTLAAAVQVNPVPTLNSPLLQSVNDAFDLAASRLAADEMRLPPRILRVLLIYALVASVLNGVTGATQRRYAVISGLSLALITLAFCLIIDLDRPSSGRVTVSELSMDRVIARIRRTEAAEAPANLPR